MESPLPYEKQELVTNNLNLVHYILRKLGLGSKSPQIYEELYQEGCIWLVRAAGRYNPELGFTFSTYASQYISGGIIRYYNEKCNTIRIPRRLVEVARKLSKVDIEDEDSIKEEYNISDKDIQTLKNLREISSLDFNVTEGGKETPMHDIIADDCDDIKDFIEEESIATIVPEFLDTIKNETHRNIYGDYIYSSLYDNRAIRQMELSEKYGVSQAHVSRIIRDQNENFKKYLKKFYFN